MIAPADLRDFPRVAIRPGREAVEDSSKPVKSLKAFEVYECVAMACIRVQARGHVQEINVASKAMAIEELDDC